MTPRLLDDIASAAMDISRAACRLTYRNQPRHPVGRDAKARAKASALARHLHTVRRRNRRIAGLTIVAERAEALCRRMQDLARVAAHRIDASRPKPTTTGPVGDRLSTDPQLARYDRMRLDGERAAALRESYD